MITQIIITIVDWQTFTLNNLRIEYTARWSRPVVPEPNLVPWAKIFVYILFWAIFCPHIIWFFGQNSLDTPGIQYICLFCGLWWTTYQDSCCDKRKNGYNDQVLLDQSFYLRFARLSKCYTRMISNNIKTLISRRAYARNIRIVGVWSHRAERVNDSSLALVAYHK